FVSIPIADDSDMNSGLQSVSIATTSDGPWTQKCGSTGSFSPEPCRIHGLIPGTNYWIQAVVSDPDGVVGTNPQVIGPVYYTGLADLALGQPITADPGWGCCSDPSELVDGVIQYPNWPYGFAWTGGLGDWGGGSPGIKQATIDLGSAQTVNRLDFWTHDPDNVPATWYVSVSTDGSTFTQVF